MIWDMLPWWSLIATACSGGLGTVAGALLQRSVSRRGQDLLRQTDIENDAARRSEEAMRTMRWAGELAVSTDVDQPRLGVRALHELSNSTLLHREDRALLAGILRAVVEPSLPPSRPLLRRRSLGRQGEACKASAQKRSC